jgi:hypothetical protein
MVKLWKMWWAGHVANSNLRNLYTTLAAKSEGENNLLLGRWWESVHLCVHLVQNISEPELHHRMRGRDERDLKGKWEVQVKLGCHCTGYHLATFFSHPVPWLAGQPTWTFVMVNQFGGNFQERSRKLSYEGTYGEIMQHNIKKSEKKITSFSPKHGDRILPKQ